MKYLKYIAVVGLVAGGFFAYSYYPSKKQVEEVAAPIVQQQIESIKAHVRVPVKKSKLGINQNQETPGVQLIPYSDDFVEEFDVGFKKWIVIFENLTEEDRLSCEIKRMASMKSENEGYFEPMFNYQKDSGTFEGESLCVPTKSGSLVEMPKGQFVMLLSAKGYLPGEKITLRGKAAGANSHDVISFYPRPLVRYDSQGKELLYAHLLPEETTTYCLYIAYDPTNPLVRFDSFSEHEHMTKFLMQDGILLMHYIPGVVNVEGGIARARCTYLNGDVQELHIPWGSALYPYLVGAK